MKKLALLLVLLATPGAFADGRSGVAQIDTGTYQFDNAQLEHLFSHTLVFGHSISSGFMNQVTLGLGNYGEGPGTLLAKKYAEVPPMANISEGMGTFEVSKAGTGFLMETGLNKIWRWVNQVQYWGKAGPLSNRDLDLMNRYFEFSRVIVGIDAFYMAVVFNDCHNYGGESGLRSTIDRFVQKAYSSNKVLILGNVPKEKWEQVSPLARLVLQNNNESCRKMINQALEDFCKSDRNCYRVDVAGLVDELNSTGQLTLDDGTILKDDHSVYVDPESGAENLGPRQVRGPDGVNLTPAGDQVLAEAAMHEIRKHPPQPPTPENWNLSIGIAR